MLDKLEAIEQAGKSVYSDNVIAVTVQSESGCTVLFGLEYTPRCPGVVSLGNKSFIPENTTITIDGVKWHWDGSCWRGTASGKEVSS